MDQIAGLEEAAVPPRVFFGRPKNFSHGRSRAALPSAALARAPAARLLPLTLPPLSSCFSAAPTTAPNGASAASPGAPPTPIVTIDNQSDAFATVVQIKYGDRLGELLDTTAALKNLGLNIRRAKIAASDGANKFYITDATTSEKVRKEERREKERKKEQLCLCLISFFSLVLTSLFLFLPSLPPHPPSQVVKSARLEEIRVTILQNLLQYHPESVDELAWGDGSGGLAAAASNFDELHPLGAAAHPGGAPAVRTSVTCVEDPSGSHSELTIVTTDRPGLLTAIVAVLKDISVNVVSAEVDTEGRIARDQFFVTYHGEPLNASMVTLAQNALQYYLSQAESANAESY